MDKITDSTETLMKQAPWSADAEFIAAINSIDLKFGNGYAKNNPGLVAAYMQACAMDCGPKTITSALQEIAESTSSD